ncbi:MAG: DMT family transporter [bacterium]|nr:DMT family transporter [bacterium]
MPYLLLTLTALIWSGNFVLGRGVQGLVPPLSLGFWRWAVALAVLAPFAWPHFRQQRALIRRHAGLICLQGILAVTGFNTLLYVAVQYTTAINAVLVNSITPILIALVAWLLHRETLRPRQVLGIILSFGGVLLILAQGEVSQLLAFTFNQGDILVLLAAAGWSVYAVTLRRLPRDLHPLAFLFSINAVGLVGLVPLYLWELQQGLRIPLTGPVLLAILYVSLCASVLAFLCWNYAVRIVGANRAGPFVHLMPVFSTILAIIFLHEQPAWHQARGAAFIFIGIVLATWRVGDERKG